MSPHSNRVLLAVLFAVLWMASMLWRAQSIDLKTVILAVIAGAVVGLLMYWLYGQFSGRFR
jgi:membrane protein DedA with SNARE-associated domain